MLGCTLAMGWSVLTLITFAVCACTSEVYPIPIVAYAMHAEKTLFTG